MNAVAEREKKEKEGGDDDKVCVALVCVCVCVVKLHEAVHQHSCELCLIPQQAGKCLCKLCRLIIADALAGRCSGW